MIWNICMYVVRASIFYRCCSRRGDEGDSLPADDAQEATLLRMSRTAPYRIAAYHQRLPRAVALSLLSLRSSILIAPIFRFC